MNSLLKNKVMGEVDCANTETLSDTSKYLAKAAEKRIPLTASFELTRRCNYKCVHCYLGNQENIRKNKHRELSTEEIFALLDSMVAAGTLFLTLTGGDPMLRPDFKEVYEYAIKAGLLTTVFCNGSLVTEEIVHAFQLYPPRIVEVTLYGARSETFEAITQKKGSFEACMNGINLLRKAGVRVRLKTILMTLNVHEFEEMRKLADMLELQFRHDCSLHVGVPIEENEGWANDYQGKKSSLRETLQFRLTPEKAAEIDLSNDELAVLLQEQKSKPYPEECELYFCGAGKNYYHLTPYGQMQPCLIVLAPCVNDVCAQGVRAGWESIVDNFSSKIAGPDFLCNNCTRKRCCTACPGVFSIATGNPEQVDEFYCRYAASRIKANN